MSCIATVTDSPKPSRSLARIAGIVAIATLISKLFGLFRQQAIAAAFGVGIPYGAYNFAYVIPGFLLVLLGGINGPFHSAIVSVVSKRKREDIAPLVETITTLVGGILLLVTALLIVFADPLMNLVAPGLAITQAQAQAQGLSPDQFAHLKLLRSVAIQQFQIMAPMAVLAGLIGIGFGTLNAADQYWLPSISPLFSSITVLIGLGFLAWYTGGDLNAPEHILAGGAVLAWSTLAGAVLQWLVQLPAQWKAGLGGLRLRFNFRDPGVQSIIKVMGPATLSSGMLQINVWTDLFFASFLSRPGEAVAALGYAGLLVQTPLGIISNMILVPLLPVFSRLADPNDWPELKQRIRQGLMMTALTMLPLSGLMAALAFVIVRVVYERFAFNEQDSQLVTSVLIAYAIGMFVYLARDVLVRVFYALEDADTPFRISVISIFLNAVFDFLLVRPLGAPGLVLATLSVNLFSLVAFLWILNRRLHGLPLREWSVSIGGLTLLSFGSGLVAYGVLQLLYGWLGSEGLLVQLGQLAIAGFAGLAVFVVIAPVFRLPELRLLTDRLQQRFLRR